MESESELSSLQLRELATAQCLLVAQGATLDIRVESWGCAAVFATGSKLPLFVHFCPDQKKPVILRQAENDLVWELPKMDLRDFTNQTLRRPAASQG